MGKHVNTPCKREVITMSSVVKSWLNPLLLYMVDPYVHEYSTTDLDTLYNWYGADYLCPVYVWVGPHHICEPTTTGYYFRLVPS